MSAFQDAGWLRRLWSLAKPGDPVVDYVTNVQVVNDRAYGSSRERAPYAQHGGLITAGGPGVHNFVEIRGADALGPTTNLLHACRWEEAMANQLTGIFTWALADGAALTTATRVATTPMIVDSDPDVACQLFVGTIATANIPAAAIAMPHTNGIGQTAATPSFPTGVSEWLPLGGLPFCASWLGPRSLILFGGANQLSLYSIAWQAMRS